MKFPFEKTLSEEVVSRFIEKFFTKFYIDLMIINGDTTI